MKRIFSIGIWLIFSLDVLAQPANFPQADISNGLVHARLYLPDTATGYYRSTRFDWAGVIPSLEYKGHSFFGQWFPRYAPTIHDAIMGPVESFSPLGYDEAAAGGDFVEIGVGILTRPDTTHYSPFRYYPIHHPGAWKIKASKTDIEFRHTLDDHYIYTKTVALTKGKPELVITHHLHNTGSQPIVTDVFDHNFFVTDSTDLAPGIVLKFPFTLTADGMTGPTDLAAIAGDSISILRPFAQRESIYAILHGYGESPKDYDIRIENRIKGVGVRITADRPIAKLPYWGSVHTLCPEPYIHVSVAPGETFTWTIRYAFYTLNPGS
jgi:hypothetical protein